MLAGSESYRKLLVRMKTLGPDFVQAASSERNLVTVEVTTETANDNIARRPAGPSQLWMRKPAHQRRKSRNLGASRRPPKPHPQPQPPTSSEDSLVVATDLETRTCQDRQSSLLDLQTNNSRRGSGAAGEFGHRGGVTTAVNNANSCQIPEFDEEDDEDNDVHEDEGSSDDFESERQNSNFEDPEDVSELENENAVAKGANALVKQTTSRQTEIIDTSRLLEQGKVETQYEEPVDEPEEIEQTDYNQIEEYEKTFAYARRLRALLNMKFKVVDRGSIETNFLLVKAHEHPKQKVIERWKNVDLGQPYDNQIRRKKLIDDFKQTCSQRKHLKKGEVQVPIYPEWIKFYIRFKKDAAEKRWNDFIAYKQKMRKLTGGMVTVPKDNDKYLPAYYDVWSTTIVAFAKPETTLLHVIGPVFAKLGLEARADFKFTIGCFVGDKRAGRAKIQGAPTKAEELTMQVPCCDLYKRNCHEIFVNDNRIEMFKGFPDFYNSPVLIDPLGDAGKPAEKTKSKKGKKAKNQSNLDPEAERQQLFTDLMPTRSRRSGRWSAAPPQAGGGSTQSETSESRVGDILATRLSIAEEAVEFDRSSPAAANQNFGVHDCVSSDKIQTEATLDGAFSTTKSGRTES